MPEPMPTMSPQTVKAIKDAPVIKCECGSPTFREAIIFKKVPGLYVGTTEPVLYPVPVYVCTECGKIMKEMIKDKSLLELINDESITGPAQEAETPKVEEKKPSLILN